MNVSHSIVCKEIFDKTSEPPTEEEIKEYAVKIGIDLKTESYLLPLAVDGLTRPLPEHWQPCYHVETQNWYYFNFKTKETIWEHPYDELYQNIVMKARNLFQHDSYDIKTETCRSFRQEEFITLEEEILSAVIEEMLPSKGFNPSNNALFDTSLSGTLTRKPFLTPIYKDAKKKLSRGDSLKSALKHSTNPKSPVSPVSNSQFKDKSLNSSSVISSSGFSSLDSKQKHDLSPYDYTNEYDNDDNISSLASEKKTSYSEHFKKTQSKNDSRKSVVRFQLSKDDSVKEDESLNKISIDDVASLGLSSDSGVVSSVNATKNKAKSSLTLMGGGTMFLKKPGKKIEDKLGDAENELESKKALRSSEDFHENDSPIFSSHNFRSHKNNTSPSKSFLVKNPSDFLLKNEIKASSKSIVVDMQNCDTVVENDPLPNKNKQSESDDDLNEADSYSQMTDDFNVNNFKFMKKMRNDYLMDNNDYRSTTPQSPKILSPKKLRSTSLNSSPIKTSKERSSNKNFNINDQEIHSSSQEDNVNNQSPAVIKKVLSIHFGLNKLDSLSSSQSNALNSQDISDENESAKLTINAQEVKRPGFGQKWSSIAKKSTSNFSGRDKLFTEDPNGDDSINDKDFSLKSDNSSVDNSVTTVSKLENSLQQSSTGRKGQEISETKKNFPRSMKFGSTTRNTSQSHQSASPDAEKDMKSHLANMILRIEGLGEVETTEASKKTAEEINRLEKSIEDKLKSKKEQTEELDRSLGELNDRLSKLHEFKEKEIEKYNVNLEKTLSELSMDYDLKIQQLKEAKEREIRLMKTNGENEIESLKKKFDVEKKLLDKKLKNLESEYDEKLNKIKREGDYQIEATKEKLAQELLELRQSNKDSLMIVKHENQSNIDEVFNQHKNHVEKIQEMFAKEEEIMELKHKEKIESLETMMYKVDKDCLDFAQLSREYEKLRCKYRILEDKYNGLKEKFLQMRSDIKLSVERKRQAKATAKFHKQYQQKTRETSGEDTDISIVQTRSLTDKPRKKKIDLPDSDSKYDTTSTSFSVPSKFLSNKETNFRPFKNEDSSLSPLIISKNDKTKATPNEPLSDSLNASNRKPTIGFELSPCEPVNNPKECLRKQLDKLEEIDSELPPNSHADSYLRYPFSEIDCKLNDQLDAEIEFYRHRLLLEYDNVVRAKEKLREEEQKVIQSKQSVPNTQLSTLQRLQLEEELSLLESSVERTRTLLTEKFRRLRLMHQTLDTALNIPLEQNAPTNLNESSANEHTSKTESQIPDELSSPKIEKPVTVQSKANLSSGESNLIKTSSVEQPIKSDAIHEKILELKDWLKKVSASTK